MTNTRNATTNNVTCGDYTPCIKCRESGIIMNERITVLTFKCGWGNIYTIYATCTPTGTTYEFGVVSNLNNTYMEIDINELCPTHQPIMHILHNAVMCTEHYTNATTRHRQLAIMQHRMDNG